MTDTGTISVDDPSVAQLAGVPYLVRVMCADAPLGSSLRVSLGSFQVVAFGRGDAAPAEHRAGELTWPVPDEKMSTQHARLVRAGGKSTLEDLGSKNGTLVNGERCERRDLYDGDVIELGHTFFVYRSHGPRDLSMQPYGDAPLVTFVPALAKAYDTLAKIAPSNVPIVALGETGTGKEVVARALHAASKRGGDLVAVNCGAIPANLVESELFGSKRGAFSGAEERPGLVRAADGGTLFLDEIGELPLPAQVALLRVLQEQEVMPVGGTKPVKVDIRLVAATHRPLEKLVDAGQFRSDLFARLTGFSLRLPPLRERREDLGLLMNELIRRITPEPVRLGRKAARALFTYAYPRNIRELEKSLALGIAVARGSGSMVVELEHLPEDLQAPPVPVAPAEVDEDAARKAELIALLTRHRGRIADVARAMGKARMQIHRWMQRYDIDVETYRKP